MKQKEMLDALVAKTGYPRVQVKSILEAEAELIAAPRDVGSAVVSFLGTFKIVQTKARIGRNPKSGEPMDIAARKVIRFQPRKEWAERVAADAIAAAPSDEAV